MCPSGNPATPMENVSISWMKRTSWYEYSKPPSVFVKIAGAARRVAAQRQDVRDAERVRLLKHASVSLARGVHARQMRHRR